MCFRHVFSVSLVLRRGLGLGSLSVTNSSTPRDSLGSVKMEILKINKSKSTRKELKKVQREGINKASRGQPTYQGAKHLKKNFYLHSWGQKPYLPSASKSFVVEHQRNPSLRPASVQLLYSLPLNQKGNLQYSPSAFPYFTLTTAKRTDAMGKLVTDQYQN